MEKHLENPKIDLAKLLQTHHLARNIGDVWNALCGEHQTPVYVKSVRNNAIFYLKNFIGNPCIFTPAKGIITITDPNTGDSKIFRITQNGVIEISDENNVEWSLPNEEEFQIYIQKSSTE